MGGGAARLARPLPGPENDSTSFRWLAPPANIRRPFGTLVRRSLELTFRTGSKFPCHLCYPWF